MIRYMKSAPQRMLLGLTLVLFPAILVAHPIQDTIPGQGATTPDTLVVLSPTDGAEYIERMLTQERLWRSEEDPVKRSLERILNQYREPYDSAEQRIIRYPFHELTFQFEELVSYDSLKLTWLNDSSLLIGDVYLDREPYKDITIIKTRAVDTTLTYGEITEFEVMLDTLLDREIEEPLSIDTVLTFSDTLVTIVIDTAYLDSMGLTLYSYQNNSVVPPLPLDSTQQVTFLSDSSFAVISTTESVLTGSEDSPFYIVPGPSITDSLRAAVDAVSAYNFERDSTLIYFNDLAGSSQPYWLTSSGRELTRYWIKNRKNDSITIWVGNPVKNEISLLLEEDVNINRMEKIQAEDIPITTYTPETSLASIEPLKAIPVYWEYAFASSFALNQTFLSNWSKGGESSFSTMLDIKGEATYFNKSTKTKWTNDGRIKYGSIITAENGLRTNTDMVEINSQYNREISKQVDFSAVFYMKNQLARGYNYPNDSVVVSRFLNPTTFTIGVGAEYKPFKNTQINLSPLSYKNTFVLDTVEIDQTNHGIDPGKRVRQEMGGQLVVKNKMKILDGLNISNSLRLFSNYFDEPHKVDMDWEITLDKRISWYASVALNLHLIYDDNIRFPVLGDDGEPVTLPDGSIQKEPKLQFKEFVGLTLSLNF